MASPAMSWKRRTVLLIALLAWVFVSFVIPQLADTQRNFAFALSAAGQNVTTVPTDTFLSKGIGFFSPAVQFQAIGNDLLQVTPDTSTIGVFGILIRQILAILCILVPGIILLLASYHTVQREDIL